MVCDESCGTHCFYSERSFIDDAGRVYYSSSKIET